MSNFRQKYIRHQLHEILGQGIVSKHSPAEYRQVIMETAEAVGITSLLEQYLEHSHGVSTIEQVPNDKLWLVFHYVCAASEMLKANDNVVQLRRSS
jgi:hypothetical protein